VLVWFLLDFVFLRLEDLFFAFEHTGFAHAIGLEVHEGYLGVAEV